IDFGVAPAAGSNRCSAPSTSCKSSSKNSRRFIFGRIVRDFSCVVRASALLFFPPHCTATESVHHAPLSPSGSNGSASTLPSAFFNKISTLPSASSSCFWHSRDSATPSSKSFIASSSDSCRLSSRRTTSSSRASERSKSGFFGADVFTRPRAGPANHNLARIHHNVLPHSKSRATRKQILCKHCPGKENIKTREPNATNFALYSCRPKHIACHSRNLPISPQAHRF